jgi:hypothetical protein
MELNELVYDEKKGHDVHRPFKIDYDPKTYKTKEAAARGLYDALVKENRRRGGPDGEVIIRSPAEKLFGYECWTVCWESGPYQWGCSAFINGPWGFCETYYGFDLMFVD